MKNMRRFIGIHFKVGVCNMRCSYCYLGTHQGKLTNIDYTVESIKKAFSKKRLGGYCFINICSDGETLIHPMMPQIIEALLNEGHYVMVVTNATITSKLKECINLNADVDRLFFKVSFHYEEMKRMGLLDVFFDNLRMIKNSPCSYTVEYITCDETLDEMEEFKNICIKELGCLPQLNMPRNEKSSNLGVMSKSTWKNYIKKWDKQEFESEFWDFRKQVFGKRYKDFCYAGDRYLWINMENGYSHQCFNTPPIQNFMGELNRPVKWIAVGNNCKEAHCYVAYMFMTMGIAPFPEYVKYRPTYDIVRNRKSFDKEEWIKPIYKEAFKNGIRQTEYSKIKKQFVNVMNKFIDWRVRKV